MFIGAFLSNPDSRRRVLWSVDTSLQGVVEYEVIFVSHGVLVSGIGRTGFCSSPDEKVTSQLGK